MADKNCCMSKEKTLMQDDIHSFISVVTDLVFGKLYGKYIFALDSKGFIFNED